MKDDPETTQKWRTTTKKKEDDLKKIKNEDGLKNNEIRTNQLKST